MSLVDRLIRVCLGNRLVVVLAVVGLVFWGALVAPFEWSLGGLPRDPVPVDAIPDIGENQQIVFTEWSGRSPQDIEDQITYPLTVSLLGLPGVKTVRSYSMFGFSTIYVIFQEDVEFYWSRSRILEKLSSLPRGTLPAEVQPTLGPDATALGQVFWYTLEGRDEEGNPAPGWGLEELRSIQDFYVRYALTSAEGVAEVASVGGHVREYQVDVDPDAMRAFGVSLAEVFQAVRMSNVDVGARTIEINRVEYVVRGLGFLQSPEDLELVVVKVVDNVPVSVRDVGKVSMGPALRRGVLDKGGTEAVGGVVVARYGENPLQAIRNVQERIAEISPGLPSKTLADGTVSKVTVVPFYDRSDLIRETLGTLNTAISLEMLVTVLVVLVMLAHLATSLLVSAVLPLAILMAFIAMKLFGVDANIVALSGIAIAIGTIVDVGVVIAENILRHLRQAGEDENRREVIFRATSEVGGAITTAVLTTIVSFLPVFTMEAAEGKLFQPLAYTKTFTLIASVVLALTVLPTLASFVHSRALEGRTGRRWLGVGLVAVGVLAGWKLSIVLGMALVLLGLHRVFESRIPVALRSTVARVLSVLVVVTVTVVLANQWLPLGPERGIRNLIFVAGVLVFWLGGFRIFQRYYEPMLRFCLRHKAPFLTGILGLVLWGGVIWLGVDGVFGLVPRALARLGVPERVTVGNPVWVAATHRFPGLGKEFMPPLDEGSYLYMPTTMPHASIGESVDVLRRLDLAISSIPEVELAVGKIGRVESPLDPAPISMVETVINYKSEYITDEKGKRLRFRWDGDEQEYARDALGELIPDPRGRPFRQWRDEIRSADDIWDAVVEVARLPGTTSAPNLQPIAARIVMLQSGMRAPMGVKVKGPDLETIERVALEIERRLKEVSAVRAETVIADRIVGKPYLEIVIDREAIARYGLHIRSVQDVIEVAVGGKPVTQTVEGRERYPVRVRYFRELRDSVEDLGKIVVPTPTGAQIPLGQLSEIRYVRGPQVIKSEDTFLVGYVVFDKAAGWAEVDAVEAAQAYLQARIDTGELVIPPGVSYRFAGSYENQVRSEKRLQIILPIALFLILLLLYLQFRQIKTTVLVFSGILVAWAGGFQLVWLYGQPWFLDFSVFDVPLRDLIHAHPLNLSVAVWVGFLALFGIASDAGVILATYLTQVFRTRTPTTRQEIQDATVEASRIRLRPCLITTATTILALLPVLTSSGRGADVMIPMAIPSFGGMTVQILTLFVVPVIWSWMHERNIDRRVP
ncbi:MAG: cation transporter [Gemmatimonadota bacterium]|nr:MAG: cation transporter [Gemmatimonadota bacterium]